MPPSLIFLPLGSAILLGSLTALVHWGFSLLFVFGIFFVQKKKPILISVCLFVLGFFTSYWAIHSAYQQAYTKPERIDVSGSFRIQSLKIFKPESQGYSGQERARMHLEVLEWDKPQQFEQAVAPKNLLVNWYRPTANVALGQVWQFELRLKPNRGYKNKLSFDYETWLFAKGIDALGYVRSNSKLVQPQLLQHEQIGLIERLKNNLHKDLQGFQHGGVLMALTSGDTSLMSTDDFRLFRELGIIHLIVISGTHLGLLLVFFATLLKCLLWLTKRQLKTTYFQGILLLLLLPYVLFVGDSLPVQRAFLSVVLAWLLLISPLRISRYSCFWLVFSLLILLDPLVLLLSGTWLSFLAVWCILCLYSQATNWPSKLVVIQLGISFGLAPALLYAFSEVPLLSPLVNLLAIPVIGFVILPLCLVCFLINLVIPLPQAWDYLHQVYAWFYVVLDWSHQFSENWFIRSQVSQILIFSLAQLAFCFALLKKMPLKPAFLTLYFGLIALIITPSQGLKSGEFKLALLDVGQALAVAVKTKNHNLVYDTGSSYLTFETIENYGVKTIDRLVLSSKDRDHSGGLQQLSDTAFIPQDFLTNEKLKIQVQLPEAQACLAGTSWTWDQVNFRILHPSGEFLAQSGKTSNNTSCVLHISSKHGSAILTGDIEKKAERALLHAKLPQADLLIAPHHGSKTSSSQEFIHMLNPRYVFISAGFLNRFKHPHASTLKTYEENHLQVYATPKSGMLEYSALEKGVRIQEYRKIMEWMNWQRLYE